MFVSMFPIAELLRSVAGLLMLAGLVVAGLVAFFVAWWIAALAVVGFALYLALRRLFPGKRKGEVTIVEGEYRRIEEDKD